MSKFAGIGGRILMSVQLTGLFLDNVSGRRLARRRENLHSRDHPWRTQKHRVRREVLRLRQGVGSHLLGLAGAIQM